MKTKEEILKRIDDEIEEIANLEDMCRTEKDKIAIGEFRRYITN